MCQVVPEVKNLPASAEDTGDVGSITGSGKSPGEENGYPFWEIPQRSLASDKSVGLQRGGHHQVTEQ